jgi:CRISPR system Cascade subunit CasA
MESATNRFNLVDEPWIPVAGAGLVSLTRIFTDPSLRALGGNPVQKIATIKLLLAIAQAAATPRDEAEWEALGAEGLAAKCLAYLTAKRDCFWLYGEKPFLQIKRISGTKKFLFGNLMPTVAAGNTTILNQSQIEFPLSDAEKASLLVCLMGFALGGKQVDNSVTLNPVYMGNRNAKGNEASGRPGRFSGYLFSFASDKNLLTSLFINLLSQKEIESLSFFERALGIPPWEKMPEAEDDQTAKNLKASYMGCLVPLCRFVYIHENGICNSDGILYDRGSKQAPKREPDPSIGFDPMLTVDRSKADARIHWVNPDKRPWRELTSMLGFISAMDNRIQSIQLQFCLMRVSRVSSKVIIWSGGLSFSDKAGEQAPRGNDDFVESEISLSTDSLNLPWFEQLKMEMNAMDDLSKAAYGSCMGYHKALKVDGEMIARAASNLFWQLAERQFQALVDACTDASKAKEMRKIFAAYALQAYDAFCPKDTARQLDAWAANKPHLGKYLA